MTKGHRRSRGAIHVCLVVLEKDSQQARLHPELCRFRKRVTLQRSVNYLIHPSSSSFVNVRLLYIQMANSGVDSSTWNV